MSVDQPMAMRVPFLLMVGFWIFVIWAVLATIGALKEIRDELSRIREELGRSGRIEPRSRGTWHFLCRNPLPSTGAGRRRAAAPRCDSPRRPGKKSSRSGVKCA